jgi:tRNA dimethylallyltransferase
VEALAAAGLRQGPTARRALGYAQVLAALEGECTLAEAVQATVHATRRYARRQVSWFGRDTRVTWLDAAAPASDQLRAALDVVGAARA